MKKARRNFCLSAWLGYALCRVYAIKVSVHESCLNGHLLLSLSLDGAGSERLNVCCTAGLLLVYTLPCLITHERIEDKSEFGYFEIIVIAMASKRASPRQYYLSYSILNASCLLFSDARSQKRCDVKWICFG